jgi:hypothetical protein
MKAVYSRPADSLKAAVLGCLSLAACSPDQAPTTGQQFRGQNTQFS